MVEVEVSEVTFSPGHGGYVVILRQKDADRWVPIFIGPGEAQSIAVNLRGNQYPRPMTFDLVFSLINALDGAVRSVSISALRLNTFYAEVELLKQDGEVVRLDARPSDAIPLALKLGLPIRMSDQVLDAAGHDGYPQMIPHEDRIRQLEEELAKAVEAEDFEGAAQLRDQISYYRSLIKPEEEGEA